MAASGAHLPPWDRKNGEEGGVVMGGQYAEILNKSRVNLHQKLRLDSVWPHLRELGMFDQVTEKNLKHNKSEPEQVLALLDIVEQGPRWQFHILLRAIALTGQEYLLPEGVDPAMYTVHLPPAGNLPPRNGEPSVSARHAQPKRFIDKEVQTDVSCCEPEQVPQPLTFRLLRAIRRHCEYNQRSLVRTHIYAFDGDAADDLFDITNCYINVQPFMKDGNLVPIEVGNILLPFHGSLPPRVIRIYADPGDGKTSFAKHIVYKWSIDFLQQIIDKDSKLYLKSKCPPWTTMVYLHARDIKTTVVDTIRDQLGCMKGDIYTLMAHVLEGEGVAVFVDGIDELRDTKAMEELTKYVKECHQRGGPTVVLLCRTDLCDIDAKYFDRFLTLEGFNEQQGIQYVKLYTEMCQLPQPPKPPAVYEYVVRHKARMGAVLSNPLKLHVFCALALRQQLKLGEEDEFNIPKLLGPLERYLLKREGDEVSKQQSMDFYKFCFYALLNDQREFSSTQLKEFKVVQSYHVFLVKSDRRNHEGNLAPYYKFPHEMVLEFFSSRYINTLDTKERMSFLVFICSNKLYRNIQNIVFQLLSQEGDAQLSLIQTMMRAMLILQSGLHKTSPELRGVSCDLPSTPTAIDKTFHPKHGLDLTSMKNAHALVENIDHIFEREANVMRTGRWLHKVKEDGTFDHLLACLEVFPQERRHRLLKGTILQMIPTTYITRTDHMTSIFSVYPLGENRWAEVRWTEVYIDSCTVDSWCPADAVQVMQQHTLSTNMRRYGLVIHLDQHRALWGEPGEGCWSQQEWGRLLDVVHNWAQNWEIFNWVLFNVQVCQGTPLKGFLSSLSVCYLPHIPPYTTVQQGTVKWVDLVDWVPRDRKLQLTLDSTRVVVPDGWTPPLVVRLNAHRKKTSFWLTDTGTWIKGSRYTRPDGGNVCLEAPVWVTETGEEYTVPPV